MEKLTNKKKARYDFFNRLKNLINLIHIVDYLTFPEKIKLGNLTSLVFKLFKKRLKTDQLRELNSAHLKGKLQGNINLSFVEEVLNKLSEELKANPFTDEYLAHFTFQHIFSELIKFNNNDEAVINKMMNFLYASYYTFSTVKVFSITDCNFTNNNLTSLLNSLLLNSRNLLNVTIVNSNLKDSDLPIIIKYLNNYKLQTLSLAGNQIGRGEEAFDLLKIFKQNDSLESVNLDNCLFNSKSINLIKEIYTSKENQLQTFTLHYNSFCLESCQNLFNNLNIANNKFLGLSFRWSPDYILNNFRREVKFSNNLIINQYDNNEFYEIYLENLNFDFLTVSKLDMRLSFILDNIFKFNSFLLGLHANLDKLCLRSQNYLFNFIKEDRLDSLSLNFNAEDAEHTNMTNLKLNDFLNVIKHLKNLKKLNLDEEMENIGKTLELLQLGTNEESAVAKYTQDKKKANLIERRGTCDTDFDNITSDQEEEL